MNENRFITKILFSIICFSVFILCSTATSYADGASTKEEVEALFNKQLETFPEYINLTIDGSHSELVSDLTYLVDGTHADNKLLENIIERLNSEYTFNGHTNSFNLKIRVDYCNNYTPEKHTELMAYVKDQASWLNSNFVTDLEKVTALNNKFGKEFEYDYTYTVYSPYELYKYKKGVCQAYATLFYLILREANVPVGTQLGYLNNELHIWNTVVIDGKAYNLDVTNNRYSKNNFFNMFLKSRKFFESHDYVFLEDNIEYSKVDLDLATAYLNGSLLNFDYNLSHRYNEELITKYKSLLSSLSKSEFTYTKIDTLVKEVNSYKKEYNLQDTNNVLASNNRLVILLIDTLLHQDSTKQSSIQHKSRYISLYVAWLQEQHTLKIKEGDPS